MTTNEERILIIVFSESLPDWLDATRWVDEGIKPEPVEHPLDVRIAFADDEPDLIRLLNTEGEWWPTESERASIEPDGTVRFQCPHCGVWSAVEKHRDCWGKDLGEWIARCSSCWEPTYHTGHGRTALEAAAELFS